MKLFEKRPLAFAAALFLLISLFTALLNIHGRGVVRLLSFAPLFIFLIITFIFVTKSKRFLPIILLILLALLVAPLLQHIYHRTTVGDVAALDTGKIHTLEATVLSQEQDYRGKPTYLVRATTIDGSTAHPTLRLYADNESPRLSIGTEFSCQFVITEYADPYLYKQGIGGSVTVYNDIAVLNEGVPSGTQAFKLWQTQLSARIKSAVNGDAGQLMAAVLLGDRDTLPEGISMNFRRSGLSHVLALSGLHLSVLALLFLRLLRRLGLPRAITFFVFLIFLFLYSAIAGFPLSLLRASGMLLLSELGRLLRLRTDPITSLFFSVSIIVMVSPMAITDLGLWLSFLATLGILLTENQNAATQASNRPMRLLLGVCHTLLATCMALCFTLLLTALTFGGTSLLTLPANLIITPLINALLLLGPPLLLFPSLFGGISEFVANLTLDTVAFLSNLRGIYAPTTRLFLVLVSILSILALVLAIIRLKNRKTYYITTITALFLSFAVLFAGQFTVAKHPVVLYNCQGSADYLLVRSGGKALLVASNAQKSSLTELEDILQESRINEIDALILLSPNDSTHEFLQELASDMRIYELYVTNEEHATTKIQQVASAYQLTPILLPAKSTPIDDISCRFIGGLDLNKDDENGFLMQFKIGASTICITTIATYTDIGDEARSIFSDNADLLILTKGQHTSRSLDGLQFPSNATVILNYTSTLPAHISKDPRVLVTPKMLEYPLK